MTSRAKPQLSIRVQIVEHGEDKGRPITVIGRDAWALRHLMDAGRKGCTTIDVPGPRWSHYVWKLRQAGIAVETIHEGHGGPFPGNHARYVLRSDLQVIENETRAAAA
ncbi:MAG: hypothetical protein ACK4P4_09135 [Allorhizobium sp.]